MNWPLRRGFRWKLWAFLGRWGLAFALVAFAVLIAVFVAARSYFVGVLLPAFLSGLIVALVFAAYDANRHERRQRALLRALARDIRTNLRLLKQYVQFHQSEIGGRFSRPILGLFDTYHSHEASDILADVRIEPAFLAARDALLRLDWAFRDYDKAIEREAKVVDGRAIFNSSTGSAGLAHKHESPLMDLRDKAHPSLCALHDALQDVFPDEVPSLDDGLREQPKRLEERDFGQSPQVSIEGLE